jgi:hypothetical protein
MPKEIIYGAAVEGYKEPFHVKVGWTADREVQVGVEADEDRSLFWLLLGIGSAYPAEETNARLDRLGKEIREIVARREPGEQGQDWWPDHQVGADVLNLLDAITIMRYSGVWATLDRLACNRLIKNIRKARDSAYGRDE